MFKGLRDEIIALNSDINNVANSEKAKKLRKKLLKIGLILAIIGYIGTIGLFICTAVLMFNDVSAGFNGGWGEPQKLDNLRRFTSKRLDFFINLNIQTL